tara:strand:+ start:565 stop:2127 length:1563 start_codon:yes stop_codon:yes gene_type:complete
VAYINELNVTKQGDSIIFLDLNQSPKDRAQSDHIRTLGVMGLHQSARRLGLPSTTLHWSSYWEQDDVILYLTKWLDKVGSKRPIFGFSNLFGLDIFGSTTENPSNVTLAQRIKENFPDSKLIVGGPNPVCVTKPLVKLDALFYGRALWLMERWLQDKPIPKVNTGVNEFGIPIYFNDVAVIPEDPIVPDFHDDYCIGEQDIVTFETRLGCKFNCTFCGYEFRGNKDPYNANAEHIIAFMEEANGKGLTRFSIVDDTFNEEQSKLDLMLDVTRQLRFKPRIVGFNRFDVMAHKRKHIEILDEIGFHGHFWGIETFHPKASKAIRKTARTDKFIEVLQHIRDEYPHWFTTGSIIVGIPPESTDEAYEMAKRYIGEGLFSGVNLHALMVRKYAEGISDSDADFARDPMKYGITLTGNEPEGDSYHDWTTPYGSYREAKICKDRILKLALRNGIGPVNPWNALSKDAMGHKLFTKEGKDKMGREIIANHHDDNANNYFTRSFLSDWERLVGNYVKRKLEYVETL